jgi:hypothetical protein
VQVHAGLDQYSATDFFAQGFDIGASCIACIDQKIGVLFRNLRAADLETAATSFID